MSVVVQRELRPPEFPVPFEMVEYLCGTRYQEGVQVESSRSCGCGTYSIGRCASCGEEVCGDHSVLRSGSRLCGECDGLRIHEASVQRVRDEEAARIRRESRPPEDHQDRVSRCSSGDMGAGQDKRPIDVDGAEIASVLIEAGVQSRSYRRPKKGFFGRELVVQGWTYETIDHVDDPDSKNFDTEYLLISVDGVEWKYRSTMWSDSTLEEVAGAGKLHDASTLQRAYWGSNTFFERRKQWDAQEAVARRAQEVREWEERRQRLIAEDG